nr:hypothetical protein CFP56_52331 [Quercus suber]
MGCPFSSCKPGKGPELVFGGPPYPLAMRLKKRGQWEKLVDWLRRWWQKLVDWLRWWWQGDNEPYDIEPCDNKHGDNEQSDDDHIYEQKVQILVEMGFAEDDAVVNLIASKKAGDGKFGKPDFNN